MQHIEVKSSNVRSVAWEATGEDSGTLQVAFKPKGDEDPKVYEYEGVSHEAYRKLLNAPSVGSHFATHVRNSYPSKRIDTPKEMRRAQDKEETKEG